MERQCGPMWEGGTSCLVSDAGPTQQSHPRGQVDMPFGSLLLPLGSEKKEACLQREEKVLPKKQTKPIL